jgi:hypothetical protein
MVSQPPIRSLLSQSVIPYIINIVVILVISFNVLQNQVLLHNNAAQSLPVAPSDLPTNDSASAGNNEMIGLTIPRGKAIARPATRLTDEEDEKIVRKNYGGRGDKPHLGELIAW